MSIYSREFTRTYIKANSENILSTGQLVSVLTILIVVPCFFAEIIVLDTGAFLWARSVAFFPAFLFLIYSKTIARNRSGSLHAFNILAVHLGFNIMNAIIIYKIHTATGFPNEFKSSSIISACITFMFQIILGTGIKRWIHITMVVPATVLTVAMIFADISKTALAVFSIYHIALLVAIIISIREDRLERKSYFNAQVEIERNSLKLQNKLRNEFISNVSHELRTPLNGIIGIHELLKETELTEEQKEYLSLARQCGFHLLDMINDLLDINCIEEKKITFKLEKVKLNIFAENIINGFSAVNKKDIEFVFSSNIKDDQEVLTDPKRLRQVITNLLSNAEKFTNSGSITLDLKIKDDSENKIDVLFSVIDTGIGIPQEKIPYVFNRFYQVDCGPAKKYQGTGLGLTISKMIVEMMDGKIWCKSVENKGSEFCFSLGFFKN